MKIYFLTLIICASVLVSPLAAFETDQFNLPKQALADIGDETAIHIREQIEIGIVKINSEIKKLEGKADRGDEKARKKLEKLRSPDAIAKAVYEELGTGAFPFTDIELWLAKHKFANENVRFKTSYKESIYVSAPMNYATLSPTVKMYGVEFGTDKISHLYQQGFQYYEIYRKAMASGATSADAEKDAIEWGQKTERTYFGTLVSGVYSNADLAANYAGLRFYQNLTAPIRIGDSEIAPLISLNDGLWRQDTPIAKSSVMLKPFISLHFNEAFNPNRYFNFAKFRSVIKRSIKKNACDGWRKIYPEMTSENMTKIHASLESWHGENYGFTPSKDFITIENVCFGEALQDTKSE